MRDLFSLHSYHPHWNNSFSYHTSQTGARMQTYTASSKSDILFANMSSPIWSARLWLYMLQQTWENCTELLKINCRRLNFTHHTTDGKLPTFICFLGLIGSLIKGSDRLISVWFYINSYSWDLQLVCPELSGRLRSCCTWQPSSVLNPI